MVIDLSKLKANEGLRRSAKVCDSLCQGLSMAVIRANLCSPFVCWRPMASFAFGAHIAVLVVSQWALSCYAIGCLWVAEERRAESIAVSNGFSSVRFTRRALLSWVQCDSMQSTCHSMRRHIRFTFSWVRDWEQSWHRFDHRFIGDILSEDVRQYSRQGMPTSNHLNVAFVPKVLINGIFVSNEWEMLLKWIPLNEVRIAKTWLRIWFGRRLQLAFAQWRWPLLQPQQWLR